MFLFSLPYDGQCCKKIWIENVHNSSESLLMLASFWVIVWQKRKMKNSTFCHVWNDKTFCYPSGVIPSNSLLINSLFSKKKIKKKKKENLIFDHAPELCQTFQHFFNISISLVVQFELTHKKKSLKIISYLTTLLKWNILINISIWKVKSRFWF